MNTQSNSQSNSQKQKQVSTIRCKILGFNQYGKLLVHVYKPEALLEQASQFGSKYVENNPLNGNRMNITIPKDQKDFYLKGIHMGQVGNMELLLSTYKMKNNNGTRRGWFAKLLSFEQTKQIPFRPKQQLLQLDDLDI